MARFREDTLFNWTKPPSDSEETKLVNAERMVRGAISEDPGLSSRSVEVFGQGSYANDTNVRLNSDIDINVRYTGGFYFDLPPNTSREGFGLNSPSSYSAEEFKDHVQSALVRKFGENSVVRKNKCITVVRNSYRIETDVVPTWNFRRYSANGSYVLGAKFRADSGAWVVNYPKQHIENGKAKNAQTNRRFKRLTRVFRKLRYQMVDDGAPVDDAITSFLLECLVWNVPNHIFTESDSWQERLRGAIASLYHDTADAERCNEWGEVSELLYLFRGSRKWSRESVKAYLLNAWHYLEY